MKRSDGRRASNPRASPRRRSHVHAMYTLYDMMCTCGIKTGEWCFDERPVVGGGQAIPGFEEAVRGMRVGGVRRIEIPGELEEKLGYSRDKSLRYPVGPKPTTFGGQRALDFVLDNETLRDFNRTLLFDIRLSALR